MLSNSGSWLQNVSVPYVIYQLTHSSFFVGASTFAQFIPGVLFGPWGGSLADRCDRRRVLLVTQSLLAVAALALWASWSLGMHNRFGLLAIVAATGTLSGLNIPSWQAFVPSLVPREDLLSAITLNSLQFNAARALGPAIAGLILVRSGPGTAFLLNALSFGFVLASLMLLRQRSGPPAIRPSGSVARQFTSAMRYVRQRRGITVSLVVSALIALLGNPITQFIVVYTEDIYHGGPLALGLLSAAMGIGALLSAPLVSGWDAVMKRATIVRIGLPLYGISCAIFGASTTIHVGFGALVLTGAGFLAVISASNTAVQIIVADSMRGRVLASRVMTFTLAYSVGGLAQGWSAEHFGLRLTVTTAGVLLAIAALTMALWPGLLDSLDDPPDRLADGRIEGN